MRKKWVMKDDIYTVELELYEVILLESIISHNIRYWELRGLDLVGTKDLLEKIRRIKTNDTQDLHIT